MPTYHLKIVDAKVRNDLEQRSGKDPKIMKYLDEGYTVYNALDETDARERAFKEAPVGLTFSTKPGALPPDNDGLTDYWNLWKDPQRVSCKEI